MSENDHDELRDGEPAHPRRPTDLDRAIGARVRLFRRCFNVSQATAAETIGVSYPQMQKYETGANRLTVSALVKLARAFGIPPEEFITSVCADIEKESHHIPR